MGLVLTHLSSLFDTNPHSGRRACRRTVAVLFDEDGVCGRFCPLECGYTFGQSHRLRGMPCKVRMCHRFMFHCPPCYVPTPCTHAMGFLLDLSSSCTSVLAPQIRNNSFVASAGPCWKKCRFPRFRPHPPTLSSFGVLPHPSSVLLCLAHAFARVSSWYTF